MLSENGSIRLWTEITKLERFKNFYLEAFSVLTIDKVKAQKWPILLILLPGRYWVLGLKILFVAEIEKLLPPRQAATDHLWWLLDSRAWENIQGFLYRELFSVNG